MLLQLRGVEPGGLQLLSLLIVGAGLYGVFWLGLREFGDPHRRVGIDLASIRWTVLDILLLGVFYFAAIGVVASGTGLLAYRFALRGLDSEFLGAGAALDRWVRLSPPPLGEQGLLVLQLSLPVAGALFLLLVHLLLVRVHGVSPGAIGFRRFPPFPLLLERLLLGICLIVPLGLVGWLWRALLEQFRFEAQAQNLVLFFETATRRGDLLAMGLVALGAVVVAPLTEEVLFRGLLYGYLRRRLRPTAAILWTSLLFGLSHNNLLALLPIFLLSCFLCSVYDRRGSLHDTIILHASFNGASLLGVWLPALLPARG